MVILGHETSTDRRTQVQTQRVPASCSGRRIHNGARSKYIHCPNRADTGTTGTTDPQAGLGLTDAEQSVAAETSAAQTGCGGIAARGTTKPSMIAYVDASVLLRVALGQSNALPEWRQIDRGVSSALIATESLR